MNIRRKSIAFLNAVDDTINQKRCSVVLTIEQNRQRNLTILIVSMTLAFYFTWIPYAISSLLTMVGVSIHPIANVIAILCAKSSIVINPILYIFYNKDVSIFNYEDRMYLREILID